MFEIIDKDTGFKDLEKRLELIKDKGVLVGISEDSPRVQFRRGTSQEFRPETSSLLIRKPVDAKTNEIKNALTKIGRESFSKGVSPDAELLKLGEEIQKDMRAQTDPPPQLATAIIVKLDNGS